MKAINLKKKELESFKKAVKVYPHSGDSYDVTKDKLCRTLLIASPGG